MVNWIKVLTIFLFSTTAFAGLKVIKDYGDTVSAEPYLKRVMVPNQNDLIKSISEQENKLERPFVDIKTVLYPNKSYMTQGVVNKQKLNIKNTTTAPFYVVGPDFVSVSWAKKNAKYLKKIGAIGLITNINSVIEKTRVEKDTGLRMTVASLEGLEDLIGVKHYPFLVYKGWIVQ